MMMCIAIHISDGRQFPIDSITINVRILVAV